MINNYELARDMAIAEAPYQELAKEARRQNLLAQTSIGILAQADIASNLVREAWLRDKTLEAIGEDTRERDENGFFSYVRRDDFVKTAETLGLHQTVAGRAWTLLLKTEGQRWYARGLQTELIVSDEYVPVAGKPKGHYFTAQIEMQSLRDVMAKVKESEENSGDYSLGYNRISGPVVVNFLHEFTRINSPAPEAA